MTTSAGAHVKAAEALLERWEKSRDPALGDRPVELVLAAVAHALIASAQLP